MSRAIICLYLAGVLAFMAIKLGYEITNARCANQWIDSGLSTRFAFGSGYMVEINGQWVPEANVRANPRISK